MLFGVRTWIFLGILFCLGCGLSVTSPEKLFQQGVEAASHRRYDEALTFFKKSVELDPTFAQAHYRLGELYSRIGERQTAMAELTVALTYAPHLIEARKLLATLYYQSKQYDQAVALLQNVDRSLRLDPDVVSILASSLMETNDLAQAEAVLKESLEQHRNHIGLNLIYARLQLHHRNISRLQMILDSLITQHPNDLSIRLAGFAMLDKSGRYDLADAFISKAIEQFPRDPKPILAWARSRIQRQQYGEAQQMLISSPIASPIPEIDQYLGLIAHKQGNANEALKRFVHAAEQFPDDLASQVLAADYALSVGDVPVAESLCFRAVQKWPYRDDLRIRLIRIYLADNRIEAAESQLKRLRFSESASIEGMLLHGLILAKKGSYEAAKNTFSKVLQQNPESAEAHYFYGLCFLAEKDYAIAASEMHKAFQLRKDSWRIRLSLAYVYFRQHKWLTALEELNAVLSANPTMREARKLRAAVYLQLGRYDRAVADYKWILEHAEDSVQVRYWLAEALAASGNDTDALMYFRQVLHTYPHPIQPLEQIVTILTSQGRYDEAISLCEEMGMEVADKTALSMLKAVVYIRQQAFGRAQSIVEELMREQRGADKPLLIQAMILEAQGKRMDAIEWYQKAVRSHPANAFPYIKLARVYNQIGQIERAIETYEGLIKLQPDYVPALNNLAYLYWKTQRQRDRALELAERALRLMPNQPEILDTIGCIHLDLGATSIAEGHLMKAVRLFPENPIFQLHVAVLRKQQGRLKEARQGIEKVLASALSENDRIWAKRQLEEITLLEKSEQDAVNAIQTLLKKGKIEDARELARSGLERNPASVELLNLMGQIYQLSNAFQMASSVFRKAIQIAPERADLHYRLALALQQQGEFDEVKQELNTAIRLGLESRDRKAAERILRDLTTRKGYP